MSDKDRGTCNNCHAPMRGGEYCPPAVPVKGRPDMTPEVARLRNAIRVLGGNHVGSNIQVGRCVEGCQACWADRALGFTPEREWVAP